MMGRTKKKERKEQSFIMLFLFFQVDDHYERFMNKRKLFAIPKKYECKKGEIYDMKLLARNVSFNLILFGL